MKRFNLNRLASLPKRDFKIASLAQKTNLELRALEREERRRQRQIDLLEEQERQERRLSQLRSQRNQKKNQRYVSHYLNFIFIFVYTLDHPKKQL